MAAASAGVITGTVAEWELENESSDFAQAQAVACAPPAPAPSTADEGVWVWVPVDAPSVSTASRQNQAAAAANGNTSSALRGYMKGRTAGARSWLKARANALVPPGQQQQLSSVVGVAKSACQTVIDKPDLALLALGAGAGLACLASRVLLRGGFVYCCFIPHFIFNSAGAPPAGPVCEHCSACQHQYSAAAASTGAAAAHSEQHAWTTSSSSSKAEEDRPETSRADAAAATGGPTTAAATAAPSRAANGGSQRMHWNQQPKPKSAEATAPALDGLADSSWW